VNVVGCTYSNYLNYDSSANVDDGSCATIKVEGCTDSDYLNYNALATFNDGSCATIKVEGCTASACGVTKDRVCIKQTVYN
jgi:hypothetical protein